MTFKKNCFNLIINTKFKVQVTSHFRSWIFHVSKKQLRTYIAISDDIFQNPLFHFEEFKNKQNEKKICYSFFKEYGQLLVNFRVFGDYFLFFD